MEAFDWLSTLEKKESTVWIVILSGGERNLDFETRLLLLKALPKEARKKILWQVQWLLSRTEIRYGEGYVQLDWGEELGKRVYEIPKLRRKLEAIERVLKDV